MTLDQLREIEERAIENLPSNIRERNQDVLALVAEIRRLREVLKEAHSFSCDCCRLPGVDKDCLKLRKALEE